LKLGKLEIVLIAAVALVLLVNVALLFNVGSFNLLPPAANNDQNTGNPAAETPKLRLLYVVNSDCVDCTPLAGFKSELEAQGFSVTEERSIEFDSSEGLGVVDDFDLNRVPSILLFANQAATDQLSEAIAPVRRLDMGDYVFVVGNVPPVFFDLQENRERGIVDVTVVFDLNCSECRQVPSEEQMAQSGFKLGQYRTLASSSLEGQAVAADYKLQRLPSIIFSRDVELYSEFFAGISNYGSKESDGNFVFRQFPPVYLDLNSGKKVGIVHAIFLGMNACASCYDVNLHTGLLSQVFGLEVATRTYVDVASAEGKKLLADYNVFLVPTILLSGDTNAYPGLLAAWSDFGTVASDGRFVFRNLSAIGSDFNFFDLNSNQMVAGIDAEGSS